MPTGRVFLEDLKPQALALCALRGRDPEQMVNSGKGPLTPLWMVLAQELRNHHERNLVLKESENGAD